MQGKNLKSFQGIENTWAPGHPTADAVGAYIDAETLQMYSVNANFNDQLIYGCQSKLKFYKKSIIPLFTLEPCDADCQQSVDGKVEGDLANPATIRVCKNDGTCATLPQKSSGLKIMASMALLLIFLF